MSAEATPTPAWSEDNSQTFIDYGRYFVPARAEQIETISTLIAPSPAPFTVVELCCGEGLLAEQILAQHPSSTVLGYDGSAAMLQAASARLAQYGERFQTRQFDLAQHDWRAMATPVRVVASSLAIHHLDGRQKQTLFADIFNLLSPDGLFVVADVMLPGHPQAQQVAAIAWDRAVQEQALALDGNLDGFAYFEREQWNMYHTNPVDDIDKPSTLFDQLGWLRAAGFAVVDVVWMRAGHAIFAAWKG